MHFERAKKRLGCSEAGSTQDRIVRDRADSHAIVCLWESANVPTSKIERTYEFVQLPVVARVKSIAAVSLVVLVLVFLEFAPVTLA